MDPNTLLISLMAIIILIAGAVLITFIYSAYRKVRDLTLLCFAYGLFILIIGIVIPALLGLFTDDIYWVYWSEFCSGLLEIIGIGIMIYAVLKE